MYLIGESEANNGNVPVSVPVEVVINMSVTIPGGPEGKPSSTNAIVNCRPAPERSWADPNVYVRVVVVADTPVKTARAFVVPTDPPKGMVAPRKAESPSDKVEDTVRVA